MERASIPARALPIFISKSARDRIPSALPCPGTMSAGADDVYAVYPDNAAVTSIAITGPTNPTGPGDTPSRRKIFVCHPASDNETTCAKQILTLLATQAFRRPVRDTDLETLLSFYQQGKNSGGFEHGIEAALARILVDPWFIFRFEKEPAGTSPGRHLCHQRSRTGLAAFLLPLEQHPG